MPATIRRRVLNAPLAEHRAHASRRGRSPGIFYLVYLRAVAVSRSGEVGRITAALILVAGPITAALTFLASEFYLRRQVPVFFPDGRIERAGVLRVPILARLAGTFAVTSILPLTLMMLVDFGMERRYGMRAHSDVAAFWTHLVRAQGFIAVVTGLVSLVMTWLVARFINRPVQALRAAMARVATGDLSVRAPVRSADELGELNAHFNAMVDDLRAAERTREIFGRYVSPAVARDALERGVALGGEADRARPRCSSTSAASPRCRERSTPARVVEVLTEYYALVERVCEREGGVITQFLGDGVVVVYGAPLPAARASTPRAAVARRDRARSARSPSATPTAGEPLEAGHRHLHRRHGRRQRRHGRPRHLHDRRRRGEPGGPPPE